ncbi:MAG: alpha/beta hydrolase [Candidatus Kapabacteria bacterium]|jgi:proline iminopeptidase|nr:alpha/beta hydrolase [Candidatus Kapabacteria bacterium]
MMHTHFRKNSVMMLLVMLFLTGCIHLRAQEEGYSEANGVKTFYRMLGSKGLPLLIINGGPGMNSDGFAGIAQMLASGRRVIIYDQRGTGKSKLAALDTTTITMRNMVEDIESLRKHLGYQTWNVLGHSFGGLLASYYAVLYPNSIEKVILSSSGGVNLDFMRTVGERIQANLTEQDRDSLAYWNNRITSGDTSYQARLRRGMALASAYVFDKKHVPTIAERLTQGNMRLNGLVFQNLQAMKFDCSKELRSFQRPVLIIHGKNDIIGTEIAEFAHKALPTSRLVLLDSCAHYGWLDRKDEYLSAVQGFLR